MAPNLFAARQREAARLRVQVEELVRDTGDQSDTMIRNRLIDGRELRGWPAVGRVSRVVTDSVVPGSDEHLERLACARTPDS